MADKDVKLVIQAKNAASKAIDAVSDSLKELGIIQTKTGASAKQMDGLLGQLGAEFKNLSNEVAGLSALGKIADQLGKAEGAVKRLQDTTRASAQDFAKLARETEAASQATARLKGQAETLSRTYTEQKAAVAAARKEQTAANAELAKAERLASQVASRSAKHASSNPFGSAADSANVFAANEVEKAKAAASQAAGNFDQLSKALAETASQQKEVASAVKAAVANERQLTDQTDKLAASTKTSAAALGQAREELSGIQAIAHQASAALGGLAVDEEKIAAAAKSATAEMQRSKAVLAAMQRYSNGGASFTDPKAAAAQQAQRAEMEKTFETWKTLEDEAKRLAKAMAEAGQPTEAQVQAFESVVKAAGAAKAEYQSLQATLAKLQGSMQGTFAAMNAVDGGLAEGQQKLAAASQAATAEIQKTMTVLDAMKRYSTGGGAFTDPKTASSLQAQRAEIEKARNAWQTLTDEANRVATAMDRVNGPLQQEKVSLAQLSQAALAAKADVAKLEAELAQMEGAAPKGFLANFFAAFQGEGRESLSLMQRIRGEVLSLVTAYVGLYNGLSQIGGVIDAFRTMEAAQNRLGVVFNQNKEAVSKEMDFLSQTAGRLGIQFGVLSNEYSKFAVAAKAANFTTESTRKIFTSVAEAARVNKLSIDDMSGVFLALQQMISKGKIASEELRRQMGDRLPGAFNIFADALGKSTAELDKMMSQGEVFADQSTLLKVAEQMDKVFGSQLADSLTTTTTLIAKFWNEIFQAQTRIGNGGFMESFNKLLASMIDYFKSQAGHEFFLSIGSALGTATTAVRLFVENIKLVIGVLGALVAFKLAAWFITAATGMKELDKANAAIVTSFKNMAAGFIALSSQAGIAGVALTTLTGLVNAAKVAFLTFWPTLLATGVAAGIGYVLTSWASGVDTATKSLDEHKREMDVVISAYQKAKGATADWIAEVAKSASLDQLNTTFKGLASTFDNLMTKARPSAAPVSMKDFASGGSDLVKVLDQVNQLKKALQDTKDADAYKKALEDLYRGTTNKEAQAFLESQLAIARQIKESKDNMDEAGLRARAFGSNLEKVQGYADSAEEALKKLKEGIDGAKGSTDAATVSMDGYLTALNKLKEGIPEFAKEAKRADEIAKAHADANAARSKLAASGVDPYENDIQQQKIDALESRRVDVANGTDLKSVFEDIAKKTGMTADGVEKLYKSEGGVKTKAYRANANDPYTIGVGHTAAAGGIQPTAGMEITQAQGLEQFGNDLESVTKSIKKLFDFDLPKGMLDALAHLSFNTGPLNTKTGRATIIDPINKGDFATAEEGIRNYRATGAGGTIDLSKRRNSEADQFHQSVVENQAALEDKRLAVEQKITEQQEKQSEATDKRISSAEVEATYQQAKIDGLTREEIVQHIIGQYQKDGITLTDEQLQRITALANKEADRILAAQAEKQQKEEIAKVNKQITDLETTRNLLIQQRKYAQDQGDATKEQALTTQIQGVNDQLKQAIANAIQFWQGIGGPEADAAILKLQTTAAGLDNIQKKSSITGKTINEDLANGLVSAFDDFAQSIANGEDALTALGTAFRKFAANFLLEIAKMILKQALLNALQMGGGENGGIGGGIASLIGGLFHEGGVVGPGMATREASPSWFSNAMRYHTGGIAGLKPGEVPAILQTGEEVLTRDDPRHVMNGGSGAARPQIKIVNSFDSGDVVSEGLNSAVGEETLVNVVRRNASALREVLGG